MFFYFQYVIQCNEEFDLFLIYFVAVLCQFKFGLQRVFYKGTYLSTVVVRGQHVIYLNPNIDITNRTLVNQKPMKIVEGWKELRIKNTTGIYEIIGMSQWCYIPITIQSILREYTLMSTRITDYLATIVDILCNQELSLSAPKSIVIGKYLGREVRSMHLELRQGV